MQNNTTTDTTTSTPFCWQDKRVLRKIRESFDSDRVVTSALATYLALTEIASDSTVNEFTTTVPWIATKAGLATRTVSSRLQDLQRAKIVEVITPPLKAPSLYRLLPFGNGCTTSSNGCRALRKPDDVSLSPLICVHKKNQKNLKNLNKGNTEHVLPSGEIDVLTGKMI